MCSSDLDCVSRLIGDFAFVVWDSRARRLFAARDQMGGKPFFYAETADALVVSNTLACVRLHPGVPDTLNDLAIADFLVFGHNTESDTTAFAAVRRLPPAHMLEWRDGYVQVRRYWTLPIEEPLHYRRPADYVEQYRQVLTDAVRDRLRTRRVNLLMTGGLDSSSVAATAKAVLSASGEPFHMRASTSVFDRVIPDQERHFATMVAEHLGIPIEFDVADSYRLFERRDHAAFVGPEPRSVASLARQVDRFTSFAAYGRVALTGQGGDFILRPSASSVWRSLKRLDITGLSRDVLAHRREYGRWPRVGLRTRLRALAGVKRKRNRRFPAWLQPALVDRLKLRERAEAVAARELGAVDHHRPEAYWIATTSWFRLFEALDPAVTHENVEFRHPLFDLRLLGFALRVPSLPWCADKRLVREAMRGSLPEAIRTRPKTPLAGNAFDALFGDDDGKDWLLKIPDMPAFSRFVRVPDLFAATGPSDTYQNGLDKRPVLLEYLPALYLKYWLSVQQTSVPSTD